MDIPRVKKEVLETPLALPPPRPLNGAGLSLPAPFIDLSSSSSSSSESDSEGESENEGGSRVSGKKKQRKLDDLGVVLPVGFLAPLPPPSMLALEPPLVVANGKSVGSRQFWKAGDYEGSPFGDWDLPSSGGLDHVRVHPKFLHSNATSHKWALGAFAELLDNSLDEVSNGATYVNVDMLESKKDGSKMLLVEDNGGGMDPEKMRHCMSLGYSAKSKVANTIGQYGNGFKTSTMRLGADVIVFSRCLGKDGKSPTQSIGLLSYTFLRSTGKEDIVVPMLDYGRDRRGWKKIIRSSISDWDKNMETIIQWSPFMSEAELLRQFNVISDHGTRIIIYNLWEDDQGQLELDFSADPHDIQLRGVNRDEKNIQMAKEFPNSRHFLTYRHSLRSYASILYLRLPPGFRIILRGKDVQHHNIVNDMMLSQEITYTPKTVSEGVSNDSNITAIVTVGFVKDAKHHIDVQGFNVYHKNRLIKPFWRLWNAAGSDGRGVIGVLEANFVEPAHDKQGFERTTILARLETRLIQMQKNYWCTYCHKIGYAPRRNKKAVNESLDNENSEYHPQTSWSKRKYTSSSRGEERNSRNADKDKGYQIGHVSSKGDGRTKTSSQFGKSTKSGLSSRIVEDISDDDLPSAEKSDDMPRRNSPAMRSTERRVLRSDRLSKNAHDTESPLNGDLGRRTSKPVTPLHSKAADIGGDPDVSESALQTIYSLRQENEELKERLERRCEEIRGESNCEKCKSLEAQLKEAQLKVDELNKEQESLVDIFSEERERRDREEENLRKKLKEASKTMQELLEKVKSLELMKSPKVKG